MATGTGDAGIILRSAADEAADAQQFQQHYDNEMWKLWPNEGAVSPSLSRSKQALRIFDK